MLKFDWNLLWTVINLILFFLLMKKFLFKPIKTVMEKRQAMIDEQFRNAETANAEAEEKLADYTSKIANAEDEKKQIISDARQSARAEYDKIIDRAEQDSQKMKADAQKQIEEERESSVRAAKAEIASLAAEAASKLVEANITEEDNRNLLDEFLNEGSDK